MIVEVKARPTEDEALIAVPHKSWLRIDCASQDYLASLESLPPDVSIRFDMIAIVNEFEIIHVPDVWQKSDTD